MLAIYGVTTTLEFMSPAYGVCQYLGGMYIAVALSTRRPWLPCTRREGDAWRHVRSALGRRTNRGLPPVQGLIEPRGGLGHHGWACVLGTKGLDGKDQEPSGSVRYGACDGQK